MMRDLAIGIALIAPLGAALVAPAVLGRALEELTPRQALVVGVVAAQALSLIALSLLVLLFSF
jgi:hypothetical protein